MTHVGYVIAAYLLSALTLGALAAWVLADLSRQQRKLRELEEAGFRRRSEVPR